MSCALWTDLVSLWWSYMHGVTMATVGVTDGRSILWVYYIYIWGSFQQITFLDPNSVLGLVATNADLTINLYLGCFSRCTVTSAQFDHIAILCLAHPEQQSTGEGLLKEIHWAFICFELKTINFCSFLKCTCPVSWQTLTCVICLPHHRQ